MRYFFVLLFSFSFWLSKAADDTYPVPQYIEACAGDTIFLPVYINAIDNYESVHAFVFESTYFEEYYDYIGIDASQTVVPTDDILVTFPYYANFEYVRVEADLGDQTFYESDPDATILVTLMFIAKQAYEGMNPSALYTYYTDGNDILLTDTYPSLRKFITIYENPVLEISDSLSEGQDNLIISATGGLENYQWSYQKEYNADYAFDDISFSDSAACFIGNGKYTVWATDENGCSSSTAEKYIENEGVFAKGSVTADGALLSDGTVYAYVKNDTGYTLSAQTAVKDNGEFIFPGTLEKGEYIFLAESDENDLFQGTYYGNKQNIEDAFVINLTEADGVVELHIDLSSKEESINSDDFKTVFPDDINPDYAIFPNPVANTLFIRSGNDMNEMKLSVKIYNIYGEVIYQSINSEFMETIDVSSFKSGMYFVVVNNTVTRIVKK